VTIGAPRSFRKHGAFTLVEMLVAMVIALLVVALLASMISVVSKTWKQTDAQITSFEDARFAFERITRTLSQATLNSYWDFVDEGGNRRTTTNATTFVPKNYARCSDQHFLIGPSSTYSLQGYTWACFFQSPLGFTNTPELTPLNNLLNATGFFVEFNNDADTATLSMKPSYITAAKWRYRLMELLQPTEDLSVFSDSSNASDSTDQWIKDAMTIVNTGDTSDTSKSRQARPIADNIIALVFLAEDTNGKPLPTTAPTYSYDSRNQSVSSTWNQLPAQVQVTMVAIDEGSAARLAAANGLNNPPALVKTSYFQDPGTGNPATQYATDLAALEADLTANPAHLTYRVFNTTVRIESAQWEQPPSSN